MVGRYAIENLDTRSRQDVWGKKKHTPYVSRSAEVIALERAFGESVKDMVVDEGERENLRTSLVTWSRNGHRID